MTIVVSKLMQTLLAKLKIKPEQNILLLYADKAFATEIKKYHDNTFETKASKPISYIFYFVKSKAELEKQIPFVLMHLNTNATLAICFPKGKSKLKTDLSRDNGWEIVNENDTLRWVSLVAIDADWSSFLVRLKSEKETFTGLFNRKEKDNSYFDAVKKEVYLPNYFVEALKLNKVAESYFNALAYSHKREYVGYVLDAKKEETKLLRTEKVIQRLVEKKKNLSQ